MANAPLEHASAGGQGGVLTKRSDLRLYRQAIEGGYNIAPEVRQEIVAVARGIMNSRPDVVDGVVMCRDQLSAAKVLLAADKMDMDVEHAAKEAEKPGEQHLHLHGELATMTVDELRAYRERIRADLAQGRIVQS